MKKRNYESPLTKYVEVEMESGFMGGGSTFVDPDDTGDLNIENQTVGKEFDFTNDVENAWK